MYNYCWNDPSIRTLPICPSLIVFEKCKHQRTPYKPGQLSKSKHGELRTQLSDRTACRRLYNTVKLSKKAQIPSSLVHSRTRSIYSCIISLQLFHLRHKEVKNVLHLIPEPTIAILNGQFQAELFCPLSRFQKMFNIRNVFFNLRNKHC